MEYLLDKKIIYTQPKHAFRGGLDSILLAMATPVIYSGKALDVGCGSGAVALVYAHKTDNAVHITGIEMSETFAKYAQQNIDLNGFQNRMQVQCVDVHDIQKTTPDTYDIIMTNPPYERKDSGTQSDNPLKRIAHIEGSVDLQGWIDFCIRSVKARGIITMIHKADRLPNILNALSKYTAGVTVLPIITKQGQDPSRILIHIRKGIKNSFTIKTSLCIYKAELLQNILNGSTPITW